LRLFWQPASEPVTSGHGPLQTSCVDDWPMHGVVQGWRDERKCWGEASWREMRRAHVMAACRRSAVGDYVPRSRCLFAGGKRWGTDGD
jgi:hypothetical protein